MQMEDVKLGRGDEWGTHNKVSRMMRWLGLCRGPLKVWFYMSKSDSILDT